MTPAHLDAVTGIQAACAPHAASGWKAAAFLDLNSWVAVDAGWKVAAYLVSRQPAPGIPEFELLDLATHPDARRQGAARGLLGNALMLYPGTWFLEVRRSNTVAIGLYESLGFHTTRVRGSYYSHPVEDAIEMTRFS